MTDANVPDTAEREMILRAPVERGTRLKLVESGFSRLGEAGAYEANSEGWDAGLGELATYLHAA